MLKLTKTGIGLLTRQYRSVLKKCWAINVGIWRTTEDIISKTRKMMAYMLGLLDSLLNIKSNAFDEQSAKAPATELPFCAPTVAGTFSFSSPKSENVTDKLSEKHIFKQKLITSTAIGLMVATTILPSDAYAGYTGGGVNTASGTQSSAFGHGNTASGHYSNAFGYFNYANGSESSAFGYGNTASGYQSSAFGYQNHAYGYGSSVFGLYSQAGDSSDAEYEERHATAVGNYVQATGQYALALGNQKNGMTKTTASGQSAIAIGTGAQATHDNSVAIGTNSVSAGANTISVGSSSIQRQIKYVAAGTSDTDAVNLKQLNDAIAGVSGGGSSVTLDTTFDAESTNGATSQAIANYLDNNYYRKNKKSKILNGVKEGKIGNEIPKICANNHNNFHIIKKHPKTMVISSGCFKNKLKTKVQNPLRRHKHTGTFVRFL